MCGMPRVATGVGALGAGWTSCNQDTYQAASNAVCGGGVDGGVKYWKVANSWNPSWGESGYFRIQRGNNEGGIESGVVASAADAFSTSVTCASRSRRSWANSKRRSRGSKVM